MWIYNIKDVLKKELWWDKSDFESIWFEFKQKNMMISDEIELMRVMKLN